MATITIWRPEQDVYYSAAYTVLLDGKWAGKLLNEDRIVLQTSPGMHTLQLKFKNFRGNLVSFSVASDQSITFTCDSRIGLLKAFFRSSEPLSLREIPSHDPSN
jgi:hypothetical protein